MKKAAGVQRSKTTERMLYVAFMFLVALVLAQTGAIFYLNNRLGDTEASLGFEDQLIRNEIDSSLQVLRPIVDPTESMVYIPDMKIRLPLNDVTKTLIYNYGDGDGRFATTQNVDNGAYHELRTIGCSEPVRAKIEPNVDVYDPNNEKHFASVALSDGRILQVYIGTNQECQTEVWTIKTPETLGEEFKAAQSY